ncbi:MAG: hypothetical protein NTY53_26425, partial [Kiritimatiellaeota bacterium]|nr:hypothetical protein [Kiritimatiellota bacterium]
MKTKHILTLLTSLLLVPITALISFAAITPLPYVVPAVVDDRQEAQVPDRVHLDANGMLGARIQAN